MPIKSILQALCALALAGAALATWRSTYHLSCLSLIVALGIFFVLAATMIEWRIARRTAIAGCYFVPGTLFHTIAKSWLLPIVLGLSSAVLATCVLLFSAIAWEFTDLAILAVFSIMGIIGYAVSQHRQSRMLQATYARQVSKLVWSGVIAIPVTVLLVWSSLTGMIPAFLGDSLGTLNARLVWAATSFSSACPVTDATVSLIAQKDAALWQFVNQASSTVSTPVIRWLTWLTFLALNAWAAWSFARFVTELTSMMLPTEERPNAT